MNTNIPFYSDFFNLPNSLIVEGNHDREDYKSNYIRSKCSDNHIYKFIPFDNNNELNNIKLSMIRDRQLWASNHSYFEDKTEVDAKCNIYKISRKTGYKIEVINNLITTSKEMNDVSCFTYQISDIMWQNYANNRNGICLKFNLLDTDKFFPVAYLDKNRIDFTDWFIGAYKNIGSKASLNYVDKLSILPWVMKNKAFSWENEVRFLCGDIYDSENDVMGGRIAPGKKKLMNYKGTYYSYEHCGIKLDEIIIGENCSDCHRIQLENIIKEFDNA